MAEGHTVENDGRLWRIRLRIHAANGKAFAPPQALAFYRALGDRMAAAKVTEGAAPSRFKLRLPALPGLQALPPWAKLAAVGLAVLLVVGVGAAAATWGKRSYASSHQEPREEGDVFDVYSLAPGRGINGQPYREW